MPLTNELGKITVLIEKQAVVFLAVIWYIIRFLQASGNSKLSSIYCDKLW